MVELILSIPVMWQQTSLAVGSSGAPSSITDALPQQHPAKSSMMCSRVGSASALKVRRVISVCIEMSVPKLPDSGSRLDFSTFLSDGRSCTGNYLLNPPLRGVTREPIIDNVSFLSDESKSRFL